MTRIECHNYRETVSPWFRSIFALQPNIETMSEAPQSFQLHTLVGMLLFAVAVHAAGARVHRAARLPVPPVRRVPVA